jgi:hypothetical protein
VFAREEHSSDKRLRRNPRQMARPAHHADSQFRQTEARIRARHDEIAGGGDRQTGAERRARLTAVTKLPCNCGESEILPSRIF